MQRVQPQPTARLAIGMSFEAGLLAKRRWHGQAMSFLRYIRQPSAMRLVMR